MIGLLFGELHRLTIARRLALIVATIALALIANVGRAFLLVWLAATRGLAAMEHAHDIAGYGVLFVVFAGAVGIATYLRKKTRRDKKSRKEKVEDESGTAEVGSQRSEVSGNEILTSNRRFLISNFYF